MGGIEGFHKQALCGLGIAGGTKLELQGMACRVNGPIEVHPRSFHLHIRLINTPRVRRCLHIGSGSLVELWSRVLNPAIDRGVIDVQPPFQHDLFEIAITQRIAQVPAHTEQHDFGLKMTPFERCCRTHNTWVLTLLEISPSLPYLSDFLQHSRLACPTLDHHLGVKLPIGGGMMAPGQFADLAFFLFILRRSGFHMLGHGFAPSSVTYSSYIKSPDIELFLLTGLP